MVEGVKNLVRWAPIIWRDRDWDWSFLAKIMEYKLGRMAHLEETVGHHTTSLRDARHMRICKELLRRLREDNYWDNACKRYGVKWDPDEQGMLGGNFKPRTHIPYICDQSKQQAENDQKYLGLLLGKYLRNWWD